MPWRSRHTFILAVVAAVFAGSSSRTVISQVTQRQRPLSVTNNPLRPLPLAHLYWHFLVYQNHLDTVAAAQSAQGQDGSWLSGDLQRRMGFSDADFAPIRASSVRLSSELQALAAQATAIQTAGASSSNSAQLKALATQREADINAEIASLKQALSPAKITAFETFITQFFAPKTLTYQITPASGQAAPAAVQP